MPVYFKNRVCYQCTYWKNSSAGAGLGQGKYNGNYGTGCCCIEPDKIYRSGCDPACKHYVLDERSLPKKVEVQVGPVEKFIEEMHSIKSRLHFGDEFSPAPRGSILTTPPGTEYRALRLCPKCNRAMDPESPCKHCGYTTPEPEASHE